MSSIVLLDRRPLEMHTPAHLIHIQEAKQPYTPRRGGSRHGKTESAAKETGGEGHELIQYRQFIKYAVH